MLGRCGQSIPEQVSPKQVRRKSVNTIFIPKTLWLSNINKTYGLYYLVLKLSPWIYAALKILRLFLFPVRKFIFECHYFFLQIEMLPIYMLSAFYSKPLNSMTLMDHVFLSSSLSFCLISLQCRSLVSNEFYRYSGECFQYVTRLW